MDALLALSVSRSRSRRHLLRSIFTTVSESLSSVMSGRYLAGLVSSCSRNTPSDVILPRAYSIQEGKEDCKRIFSSLELRREGQATCRSAEHDTPMPTGQDAPWRGRRITRTSWQKYLPPNWAPMLRWWQPQDRRQVRSSGDRSNLSVGGGKSTNLVFWASSRICLSRARSRKARPCLLPDPPPPING